MHDIYPTVSVIVPCYNAGGTIERCINSILAQTIPVTEILVYNDCSQDNSSDILERISINNPKIKVFTGLENKGAGYARNILLNSAQGDILAFLDADDIWLPSKLEVQLDIMKQSNADIVVCDYNVLTSEGDRICTRRPSRSITYLKMHLSNEIPTSMAIFHNKIKGYEAMPLIPRRQDYAYWLRLFSQNTGLKCAVAPGVLGAYYKMPDSLSSNMIVNLKANYTMFRKIMSYSVFLSAFCVFANILTRIARR